MKILKIAVIAILIYTIIPNGFATAGDSVRDLAATLAKTASIIAGDVSAIRYTYTPKNGPWTIVTLTNVVTLFGTAQSGVTRLKFFGGPHPGGGFIYSPTIPVLRKGKRHILFLRKGPWVYSPLVDDHLSLRLESVLGRTVLVNSDGFFVAGINQNGIDFLPSRISTEHPFRGERTPAVRTDLPTRVLNSSISSGAFLQSLRDLIDSSRYRVEGNTPMEPTDSIERWTDPTSRPPAIERPEQ